RRDHRTGGGRAGAVPGPTPGSSRRPSGSVAWRAGSTPSSGGTHGQRRPAPSTRGCGCSDEPVGAALRAAGWTTPVRGCLAATAHAVPLGPVEVIRRPLDGEAIQRALSAHAGRGARVLIVGTDVDFFAALREALGRRGLSVSMAWDAHHVDDLLAMVRPDVALIDLALGSRDVRPIVARL